MADACTVTEVTRLIKTVLGEAIPPVLVEGEVTNFRDRTYWYFGLKDENAYLPCVCFAPPRDLALRDGMKVRAGGEISVYEKRGVYQLYVARLEPVADRGELLLKFEELKQRLAREGIFSKERRPLPPYPSVVGVVTSPTAAALADIATIIGRRFPSCRLLLVPVRVQGEGAAEEIARGVDLLNEYGAVDVIIVTRGGGSLEDLWPFNEEVVARAIFRSAIPVVSAVGHETDFTCADFAADLRAATPSAAAELVVPRATDVRLHSYQELDRARQGLVHRIDLARTRLTGLVRRYGFLRPVDLLNQRRQAADELMRQGSRLIAVRLADERRRARHLQLRLASLDPRAVLGRGYAIARRLPARTIVRASRDLAPADRVEVEFQSGRALCAVEKTHED